MSPESFSGCKLALFQNDLILVYKRDQKEGIPYPGMLDLPGGGREGDETPEECVLRELKEEFSITLPADRLIYRKRYELAAVGQYAYFFCGLLHDSESGDIVFGNEGEYWQLMDINRYLSHPLAMPHLKARVAAYLEDNKNT